MTETKMRLVDWLDDLCVRFIINLPEEELGSPERICFQIEEAQWFYEDFIRPLDPTLPSLNLRKFCDLIFQHCPLLSQFSSLSAASYSEFLAYKTRVPVRGAIMLNDDMTEVVLVKGWKKGAKWSFPRGKINKDEKDLDCAIREVYEETGYDIKAAGLVPDDEVKSLDQTMREQHMQLFVFRGIPMDTYFEPRTRKEISKIAWYKLADLPTLKREKHADGEEGLKGSHFYMVAPFIRALKVWIKQQRKQDKMHGKLVPKKHVILEDDEEAEDTPAVEEPTEDEAPLVMTDAEDTGHMERLLFNLRTSRTEASDPVNAPEVSPEQSQDLSTQLKMMLSIGGPTSQQALQEDADPLLAMLRGSQQPPQEAVNYGRPPQTPAEQMQSTPPQAMTPHHHHPRPPRLSGMPPPPPVPYPHGQDQRFHPHGPRPIPNQQFAFNNGFPNNEPIHQQQQFQGPPPRANFLVQGPQVPQRQVPRQQMQPPMQQQVPKPWERTTQFAPQFPQYNQASVVPAASKLPPPKLTDHARNLLNVFKSPTPNTASPAAFQHQAPLSIPAPGCATNLPTSAQGPSSPQTPRQPTQSPALLQLQTAKPRNIQQAALLNLFRGSTSHGVQQSSQPSAEPVELSAQSSPQFSRQQEPQKLSMRHLPALNTAQSSSSRSPGGLTSATVSGPLNAPNFESLQRRQQQKPAELGVGDSPSPRDAAPSNQFQATAIPLRGPATHPQQSIGPPKQTKSPPQVPFHTVTNRTPMEAPQPFHPTSILRRPNQEIVDMMSSPPQMSAPPVVVQLPNVQQPILPFDKRQTAATQQKQTLLNLFGGMKPSPPLHLQEVTIPISALPGNVSGVGSPVSPLPAHATLANRRDDSMQSATSNPDGAGYRSTRVSSVQSDTPTVVQHPQTGRRASKIPTGGPTGESESATPGTPVDKKFLLGFLEEVAKTGGTNANKGKGKR